MEIKIKTSVLPLKLFNNNVYSQHLPEIVNEIFFEVSSQWYVNRL